MLFVLGCVAVAIVSARLTFADAEAPKATSAQAATDWSREDAAHLLRRATFGGTPEQIDALHVLGRDAAIEYLISGKLPDGAKPVFTKVELPAYEPVPVPEPDPAIRDQMRDLQTQARKDGADSEAAKKLDALRRSQQQQMQRNERVEVEHARSWWVDRMLRSDRPLEEKMTLFWHNLFTSGVREVRTGKLMSAQVVLFHKEALGNYRKLTHDILHDGAMLKYLNNDQNVRGKPNENLARELMELFTLGEGNGYTEQDIKEVARALTGLAPGGGGFRPGGAGGRYASGPVAMRTNLHDSGTKVIFGKSGNFGPDDVVELIFSRPEPSKYLAKRLWTAFAYPDPSEEDLAPVLKAIQETKYDLQPALRAMFSSPAFYGEKAKFALIKSPAEVAVGTMRLLGRDTPSDQQVSFVLRQMTAMDQELLQPPNVRGWVGGDNWITAATLFTRYNTASSMVSGASAGGQNGRGRFTGGQLTPEQMQMMQQQRARQFGPAGDASPAGPAAAQKSIQQLEAEMRQRSAAMRDPATRPAEPAAKVAEGSKVGAPPVELAELMRRRRAEQGNPTTRPAGAAAADPRAEMRAQMAANPALREQMMQQFAGRRGGGPGGASPMAPIDPTKLLPNLGASPTSIQVVDAAISRFIQRPLHPEKRDALIAAIGDEPIKIGTPESDNRIRQIITLVLSTPEYQVQ
jgi:uncharacterized protein (DUF1800 family)